MLECIDQVGLYLLLLDIKHERLNKFKNFNHIYLLINVLRLLKFYKGLFCRVFIHFGVWQLKRAFFLGCAKVIKI